MRVTTNDQVDARGTCRDSGVQRSAAILEPAVAQSNDVLCSLSLQVDNLVLRGRYWIRDTDTSQA